jgi:hypothetical protein
MMHSSGENGRKRKNDSDKRGAYRKFDEASSRMRNSLIQTCAERVIAHAASNGGRCHRDFVKDMVGELYERAPLNDKEGGEMGTTGLVFGHSDESEDESDD